MFRVGDKVLIKERNKEYSWYHDEIMTITKIIYHGHTFGVSASVIFKDMHKNLYWSYDNSIDILHLVNITRELKLKKILCR